MRSLPCKQPIVHLSRPFDHPLGVEFACSLACAVGQHRAQPVVAQQRGCCAHKTGDVSSRDEQTALPIFDHLGKIKNPDVPTQPSAYAIKVNKKVKTGSGD